MNKRGYVLLLIIVVGLIITAGIVSMPKKRINSPSPNGITPQGELILTTSISGKGHVGFKVNKTWDMVGVWITYDPSTLSDSSYIRLYDSNGNLQQDFNVGYEDITPGTKDKSGVKINLGPPMNGPYGTWIIAYNLPKDADVTVQIYKTPLNNTS